MPRPRKSESAWLEYLDARGVWYVRWRDPITGQRRRQSTGTADRRQAEKALAQKLLDLDRHPDAPPEATPVAMVIADYLGSIADRPSAPQAAFAADHLLDHFAAAVSDITPAAVSAYAATRAATGIANATISRELSVLRAALNHAHRAGWLATVPHVAEVRRYEPRDRWLTDAEAAALIEAAESTPHVHLFITLALATGSRPRALLDLKWFQVDLDRRTIALNAPDRAQTAKRRPMVRMSATAHEALSAARDSATSENVIAYNGKPVRSIKKGFAAAARRAGLPGITPYVLRHTAATWMMQAGVDPWQVAGMLGHADTSMVMRVYGHHHPDFQADATAALDRRMGRGEKGVLVAFRSQEK